MHQESFPNEYSLLHESASTYATPPNLHPSFKSDAKDSGSYYIPCDAGRDGGDYDTASLLGHRKSEETYDYVPQVSSAEDYDYESPYWAPSSERSKLLEQFRKLQIPSVSQKELEWVNVSMLGVAV